MKYFSVILSICLFIPLILLAHTDMAVTDLKFDRISIDQGLSQVTVYCLIQDHRGFIWIGTMDGLNKYDGYKFDIFRHNPSDSSSISNNRIRVIFEDSQKNIWIGTDGGLNKYDPDINQFKSFLNKPDDHNSISNNIILSICEDRQGFLWVGTENGLNRFDPITGSVKRFLSNTNENNSLINNRVYSLLCDGKNDLWIGTSAGLQRREFHSGVFHTISADALNDHQIYSIYENNDSTLWIGSSKGLFELQRKDTDKFQLLNKSSLLGINIPPAVLCFLRDRFSTIWIGTTNGLYNLTPDNKYIARSYNNPDDPFSISGNEIRALWEDNSNNLWIGTYGGGINKIELHTGHFEGITFSSLQEKFIYAITQDASQNIWIGSNAGVIQYDQNLKVLSRYRSNSNNNNSISDNRIRSIYVDKFDKVWIGSYGGIDIFSPATKKFTHFAHDDKNPYSLSENTVIQIFEDSKQNIWVATQGGLNRFDRNSQKFFRYQHNPNDPASLSENQVRRIHEDHMGNIWVGTYGGGINLFNPINNSFTAYKNNPDQPGTISSNYIYSIFQDSNQNLWIGTYGGGLNRYDFDSNKFVCYKQVDGLPNNVVYGILEDAESNLWLSTNYGLSKFNIDSVYQDTNQERNLFRNFDMGDGLPSNEFNFGAYYKCADGDLYFGCINGLVYFHPENIRDNLIPPEVIITDFYIANKKVDIFASGQVVKHINQVDEIFLSHDNNMITFEFAGLHFSNPAKNKYAYMLEGVDKDWVHTDARRRYATYTTLPGGDYIFKVKAANSDGVWNEHSRNIKVIISPQIWETWYIRTILSLILILVVIVAYRIRTHQINLRNKYLESINTELNKNIQHRKKVERDLQEGEEKYRTLTTNLNAGIYRILPQNDGKFIEVNPALIKILGYKNKSDLLRVPVVQLYQIPEDRKLFVSDLNKNGHIDNREVLLKKKDGSPVWCSINAVAVKNEAGEVIYHDGLIDDISEKKLMENRIRQTQKMEAIGQLAGGVAHDFNNILTVIQGHAELGMMKIESDHPVHKDLTEIHHSGERAGNLTRQLLAFSRKQPMTLQILDINKVITNLEKMVRRLIGEDIQMIINLASGLPAINADPGQLEQILLNILINARDAINSDQSENDRTINIDTQLTILDKDFVAHHPGSKAGPHVLIAISDTGVGMNDQVKSKIFDPFFTTKEPGKGTGLGLATVFGIVKQNKGSIYVVSEPGKGTIFTIYWPAVEQAVPKDKSRTQFKNKMEGKESVLLVEDDEAVRLFTNDILKNLGYQVEQAAHGEAALYLINEKNFTPDLIITDIIMPIMNGRELADKIKEILPKTKVLLMSGYSDNQISLDGKLDKDIHFIAKPFSINNFAKKIRDVLRK